MSSQIAANHEDIMELLGVYALDAVEAAEADLVARHLEVCPRCRGEVQEHREVAGLLGYAGQEAPAGLWDRISASTQEAPPALRLHRGAGPGDAGVASAGLYPTPAGVRDINSGGEVTRLRRPGARTLRGRSLAALGAAAAVAIAVLGLQVVRLDHRTASISQDMAAGAPTMSAVDRALAVPGARKVLLSADTTAPAVQAVILPGGQGFLYNTRLHALGSNQTYQLWGVTDAGEISYGILGATPSSVVGFQAGDGVRSLAITAEVAGGAERSTHAPVASGSVPAV